MTKKHLKRHAAPRSWPILRKQNKYIARPRGGAHSHLLSLPLTLVLRDILKQANTSKEVKRILAHNEVFVDGIRVKDHKRLIGFMDVISIPKIKQQYRIILNHKGKLEVIEISEKEASLKLSKITGKTLIKGKTQLNLIDGRNILVDKGEYQRGDVLLLELPSQVIKETITLKKKSKVILLGGRHIGEIESVEDISGKKITLKTDKGDVFETDRRYAFAVGKDKPIINVTQK